MSVTKKVTTRATKLIAIAISESGKVEETLDCNSIKTVVEEEWSTAAATANNIAANAMAGTLLKRIYDAYKADLALAKAGITHPKHEGFTPHLKNCMESLGVTGSMVQAYRVICGMTKAQKQLCWKTHCSSLLKRKSGVAKASFTINNIYRGYMSLKGAKSGSEKSNESKRGKTGGKADTVKVPAAAKEEIKSLKSDKKRISDASLAARKAIAKAIKESTADIDLDTCPEQNIHLVEVLNWCQTGKWETIKVG